MKKYQTDDKQEKINDNILFLKNCKMKKQKMIKMLNRKHWNKVNLS